MNVETLWTAAEERLGYPVPRALREQFLAEPLIRDWGHADSSRRARVLDTLVERTGRGHPAPSSGRDGEIPHSAELGERWDLMSDLFAQAGRPGWDAATFGWRIPRYNEATPVASELDAPRIRLEFDARMPLATVERELRRIWPSIRSLGLLRPARTLSPRTVRLIRLVCLESERDATWSSRHAEWERRFGRRRGWSYKDPRAFRTAFAHAAQALTGRLDGLRFFYDPSVWAQLASLRDVAAASDTDRRAAAWYGARCLALEIEAVEGSNEYLAEAQGRLRDLEDEAMREALRQLMHAGVARRHRAEREERRLAESAAVVSRATVSRERATHPRARRTSDRARDD